MGSCISDGDTRGSETSLSFLLLTFASLASSSLSDNLNIIHKVKLVPLSDSARRDELNPFDSLSQNIST